MPIRRDDSDGLSQIQLEGDIDIAAAAEIKKILVEALGSGNELRVSLRRATGLDVTAIQLLHAAEEAASHSGVRFTYDGCVPQGLSVQLAEAGFAIQSKS